MPPVSADAIADCVFAAFQALPTKCKPRRLPNGRKEWTILAGVVLSREIPTPALECVSLATGMKCLPVSKLAEAKGSVLHDWHAEILALRGFNRWLVDECAELAKLGREARHKWLMWRTSRRAPALWEIRKTSTPNRVHMAGGTHDVQQTPELEPSFDHGQGTLYTYDHESSQPFALQSEVKIHLYVSAAPCGDASMELTMASQKDSTPWTTPAPTDILPGRSNFDLLGVVRRKPARPDAPITWSKSCSDKLALKQATGLLSGIVAADDGVGLVWPGQCYLSSLVLPQDEIVPAAMGRCFGHGPNGRSRSLAGKKWKGGYTFTPFSILGTSRVFEYAKPPFPPSAAEDNQTASVAAVGSNISALSTPTRTEVLINGVLQGRKQGDPKGASSVSRRGMWEDVRAVIRTLRTMSTPPITPTLKGATAGTVTDNIKHTITAQEVATATNHTPGGVANETYSSMKSSPAFAARRIVKQDVWTTALQGWKKNEGDDDWSL